MAAKTSEVIYLGTKTDPVRLSYPKLFKAKAFEEGQTPRFEAAFLLDPSNATHADLIKTIKKEAAKLAKAAYGEDFDMKELAGRVCFGEGNKKPKVPEGYADMFYVNSANTTRPGVANRAGNTVAEGDPQCPYGGCYVIGSITLWAQNNKYGKRINANLRGVQFVKDGPAFGQAPVSAETEFEALEDNSAADNDGSADWNDDDDVPF